MERGPGVGVFGTGMMWCRDTAGRSLCRAVDARHKSKKRGKRSISSVSAEPFDGMSNQCNADDGAGCDAKRGMEFVTVDLNAAHVITFGLRK
jgi:hypothetical protein